MPESNNDRVEASSLLPLQNLNAGADHRSEDGESDLDILNDEDYGRHGFDAFDRRRPRSWRERLLWAARFLLSYLPGQKETRRVQLPGSSAQPVSWKRRLPIWILSALSFCTIFVFIFLPSYTHQPPHYVALRDRALASSDPGRANTHRETIFIAASIYDNDGSLLNGAWGEKVLQLIDLLGPGNVYVSIYENDASEAGAQALSDFKAKLTCDHSVVNEHINTEMMQRVTLPDGTKVLKRMAFLSYVRNKAIEPLYGDDSPIRDLDFDKLLFLNDVVFDPIDAANLLFSTNRQPGGLANYRSACAVDFVNPFKFYDTFATRDLEGYDMGVPFYPWFTTAGKAESRDDVLAQKDAVRVRSCWGGMVAFDAKYFRKPNGTSEVTHTWDKYVPARFRAEDEPFWDSSECCLLQADIQYVQPGNLQVDTGIYMNPYIRVAYDSRTLSWLGFTRRFERMYTFIQRIVNYIGGRPSVNPRRREPPEDMRSTRAWEYLETTKKWGWKSTARFSKPGGFCGKAMLWALAEDGTGANWWKEPPPPGQQE